MSEQAFHPEPSAQPGDPHKLAPRAPGHIRAGEAKPAKRTFMDRIEAFISRLSTRNNFWHRVTSMIFLPYAFRSGITMRRLDGDTFQAILPFRKINKNWYNAMAGAALLGNTEIAGGMYVFGFCGGDYTVVCKNLEYRFLRPCLGPAIYKIRPKSDIAALSATGQEFDATVQLDIYQAISDPRDRKKRKKKLEQPEIEEVVEKEKRVGRATAIFHATPKLHQKSRGRLP